MEISNFNLIFLKISSYILYTFFIARARARACVCVCVIISVRVCARTHTNAILFTLFCVIQILDDFASTTSYSARFYPSIR